jgi:hypothetical protein
LCKQSNTDPSVFIPKQIAVYIQDPARAVTGGAVVIVLSKWVATEYEKHFALARPSPQASDYDLSLAGPSKIKAAELEFTIIATVLTDLAQHAYDELKSKNNIATQLNLHGKTFTLVTERGPLLDQINNEAMPREVKSLDARQAVIFKIFGAIVDVLTSKPSYRILRVFICHYDDKFPDPKAVGDWTEYGTTFTLPSFKMFNKSKLVDPLPVRLENVVRLSFSQFNKKYKP